MTSGVLIPTALPTSGGWQVADWLDRSYTAPVDSTGVALVTVPPVSDFERWQLTHMVAGCTSVAVSQMRLYLDDVSNANLRDGTRAGNFSVADWPQGLWIPPGRQLLARWTSATPGALATLTFQATVLRRVG